MPRIDPLQLLNCLSVLLTPEGGILSRDEVTRLVNLMTKFSKKLVSKCVYVLILKSTGTELVDLFMAEGGWSLIQTWLQDAVQTSNWDLVREILGLLLVTPVDVERLKLNILPKLIKSLSRREDLEGVSQLSSQLVQQWLMIVKGTAGQIQQQVQAQNQNQIAVQNEVQPMQTVLPKVDCDVKPIDKVENNDKHVPNEELKNENDSDAISTGTFYKTSGKDGKLLIRKSSQDSKGDNENVSDDSEKSEEQKGSKKREKSKTKSPRSSSSNKSKVKDKDEKKSGKEMDSGKDKEKERDKDKEKDKKKSSQSSSSKTSSSSKHKSSSSSSRSKEDREKDKHRDKGKDKEREKYKDSEKDKHRSNGALKTTSSNKSIKDKKDNRDKERVRIDDKEKEKQIEKDNITIEKLKPPSIDKLGRIPKKTPLVVEEKSKDNIFELKKKGFSVGIRKDKENDERPKTVKVFNSKMRSTGLEEEVKPAPPRAATTNKKPTPSVQLPTIPQKRPSPPKDMRDPIVVPPEKKLKLDKVDLPERPGAIKLIPPKPKRVIDK